VEKAMFDLAFGLVVGAWIGYAGSVYIASPTGCDQATTLYWLNKFDCSAALPYCRALGAGDSSR
jgi:hypothetical protein